MDSIWPFVAKSFWLALLFCALGGGLYWSLTAGNPEEIKTSVSTDSINNTEIVSPATPETGNKLDA